MANFNSQWSQLRTVVTVQARELWSSAPLFWKWDLSSLCGNFLTFLSGCSWTLPNCEFFAQGNKIWSLYSHLMFWKAWLFYNVLSLLFCFVLFLKRMQLPWQLLPTLELRYWEFLAWLLFACAARSTVIKQTLNYSSSHLLRQLMWQ